MGRYEYGGLVVGGELISEYGFFQVCKAGRKKVLSRGEATLCTMEYTTEASEQVLVLMDDDQKLVDGVWSLGKSVQG